MPSAGARGAVVSRERRQLIAFLFIAGVSLYAAIVSTKTQVDVHRIEPQVTQVVHATAACREAALDHPKLLQACAHRIRVGLEACEQDADCRAGFLSLMQAAVRKGVVPGGSNPHGLEPGPGETSGPETQPSPESPGSEPRGKPSLAPTLEGVDDVVERVAGQGASVLRPIVGRDGDSEDAPREIREESPLPQAPVQALPPHP